MKKTSLRALLFILLLQHMALGSIIAPNSTSSKPAFSIDFGSTFDRGTATKAVKDTKT